MQIYADFKQQEGGVERGCREEAVVEVHCKYTVYIHIFFYFFKHLSGMLDLRLKDTQKIAY